MARRRGFGKIDGFQITLLDGLLTPAEGQVVETVADLTTDSGDWNEELIRDIFFPVDANAILKLPMTSRGEDFWAWEQEKHGNYSVKFAYRLQEYV